MRIWVGEKSESDLSPRICPPKIRDTGFKRSCGELSLTCSKKPNKKHPLIVHPFFVAGARKMIGASVTLCPTYIYRIGRMRNWGVSKAKHPIRRPKKFPVHKGSFVLTPISGTNCSASSATAKHERNFGVSLERFWRTRLLDLCSACCVVLWTQHLSLRMSARD